MKVELIEKEVEDIKYPCLMVSEETGCIVLFEEDSCGVVVNLDNSLVFATIGRYSKDWNMSRFSKFNGKVILKND